MQRLPVFTAAALAVGIIGFGEGVGLVGTALGQPQIDQEWESRYPASGASGLIDEAVGVGVSLDAVYVAGTRSLDSSTSEIVLLMYGFNGGSPVEVHWPANSSTNDLPHIAKKMAIRTDPVTNDTVIAIACEVPRSGGGWDVVTLCYVKGSDADVPELAGTATFAGSDSFPPGVSNPHYHAVDVAITPSGG